jgi:hypothetical protein
MLETYSDPTVHSSGTRRIGKAAQGSPKNSSTCIPRTPDGIFFKMLSKARNARSLRTLEYFLNKDKSSLETEGLAPGSLHSDLPVTLKSRKKEKQDRLE